MKEKLDLGIRDADTLHVCTTVDEVGKALDALGIPDCPLKREAFLNQFMGVTRTFGCGKTTPDEDYYIACQELVFMNELRNKGQL